MGSSKYQGGFDGTLPKPQDGSPCVFSGKHPKCPRVLRPVSSSYFQATTRDSLRADLLRDINAVDLGRNSQRSGMWMGAASRWQSISSFSFF